MAFRLSESHFYILRSLVEELQSVAEEGTGLAQIVDEFNDIFEQIETDGTYEELTAEEVTKQQVANTSSANVSG